jgi:hypothetical protein
MVYHLMKLICLLGKIIKQMMKIFYNGLKTIKINEFKFEIIFMRPLIFFILV